MSDYSQANSPHNLCSLLSAVNHVIARIQVKNSSNHRSNSIRPQAGDILRVAEVSYLSDYFVMATVIPEYRYER